MTLFTKPEQQFVSVLGRLIDCNPFLPERVRLEQQALGSTFVESDANWNLDPTIYRRSVNVISIAEKADALLHAKRDSLKTVRDWTTEEQTLYADLVDYAMFSRMVDEFGKLVDGGWQHAGEVYKRFAAELQCVQPRQLESLGNREPCQLFAVYFQLYRAFRHIFDHLIGSSHPTIQLRAEVWRSIFSHNIRRYREYLYPRMRDFSTLITGPSGSGKELVARAIGLSSFVPYCDNRHAFELSNATLFSAINLSAMSPNLIESELFGHKRGAYTGAMEERQGWLEACPQFGSVFLDEIGELDERIQVKLLRVLQERTFHRLGDAEPIPFHGKVIAATNRDLAWEMREGGFRQDLYYRLCSDRIEMPSLAARFHDDPAELPHLVEHLLGRIIQHQDNTAGEILAWIQTNLGSNYAWPGNVRELEQCVRSWLIRKDYQPAQAALESADCAAGLSAMLKSCTLTAEELVAEYCRAKYELMGSYQAVGSALNLDRRTVKARVDETNA